MLLNCYLLIVLFAIFAAAEANSSKSDSSVLLRLKSSVHDPYKELPFLRQLHVSRSSFKDELIANTKSNMSCLLEWMDLSGNQNMSSSFNLVQELLMGCKNLKVFNLSGNHLGGGFHHIDSKFSIGDKLEVLDLSDNKLGFNLPSSFFLRCRSLKSLDLSTNSFTGEIPETLFRRCTALEQISLAHNNFSSYLPSLISLPYLKIIDASYNAFKGQVPAFRTNLRHLNLSSNSFTITSNETCPLTSKLESLILVNNELHGRVLDTLKLCNALKMLDLSFNSVTGQIPENICDILPKLEYFLAWVNNLEGGIPSNLMACNNLTMIILSYNNLEGNIPAELVSSLIKLQWLSLSNNKLIGEIPSLENAKEMLVLQLSNNSLQGKVPSRMGMQVIELRKNKLTGNIPPILGFTRKTFVKATLDSLKTAIDTKAGICMDTTFAIQGISLDKMKELLKIKSGGCFPNVNLLPALTYGYNISSPLHIDISHNNLYGEIPSQLSEMQDLQYLNFGHNDISGVIPAALGVLKNMAVLDLSHNNLQGEIPYTFLLLSSLSALNLCCNNLSGIIPQGGQLTTLKPSSFEGNEYLCGFPLSACRPPNSLDNIDNSNIGGGKVGIVLIASGFGMFGFVLSFTIVIFVDMRKKLII
ncbi:serine/threonine-protein kinase BRI1-like 2 [Selaginella moellendorffii]|uniref:serine/threonine-protein kinase BRI1-like 2 n=1 Tax=Selaginella moellendorffii TaxID=88036 RepID=UPI000D1C6685|nr:serine/threonine-protein kinase BRI1-like 2 [Selaginella moellendorffii]|eukprot:XP_024542855.1 serine/threonine-protein kinase BRI1-like 2 [Selaginella moellendorffii]